MVTDKHLRIVCNIIKTRVELYKHLTMTTHPQSLNIDNQLILWVDIYVLINQCSKRHFSYLSSDVTKWLLVVDFSVQITQMFSEISFIILHELNLQHNNLLFSFLLIFYWKHEKDKHNINNHICIQKKFQFDISMIWWEWVSVM